MVSKFIMILMVSELVMILTFCWLGVRSKRTTALHVNARMMANMGVNDKPRVLVSAEHPRPRVIASHRLPRRVPKQEPMASIRCADHASYQSLAVCMPMRPRTSQQTGIADRRPR